MPRISAPTAAKRSKKTKSSGRGRGRGRETGTTVSSKSKEPAPITLESLKAEIDIAVARMEAVLRDIRDGLIWLQEFVKGLRSDSAPSSSNKMSDVEMHARLRLLEIGMPDMGNNFKEVTRDFGAKKSGDGNTGDRATLLGNL